jgi:hypothetical protein
MSDRVMQRIVHTFLIALFGLTASVNVWAAETSTSSVPTDPDAPAARTSNMQSWQNDDRRDNWTWFGMGYESRHSFSETKGATTPGSAGGGKASGSGGPGGRR